MSKIVNNFDEALNIYQSKATDGKCDEDIKLSEDLALELVDQMTFREKATMLRGHWAFVEQFIKSGGRSYNAYPIEGGGCKRLGIPTIKFTDGPRGVIMGKSTCFPTSNVRAASFDRDLEYQIGTAIAKESIAQGANYFAGICINLPRNPRWGRAKESYGEDQYMLGQMGIQLTKACQEHGVIACPKHFAMNSMENLRFKINVQADEETIRDVYLPHFKDCIDAGAQSIMGAYNMVKGTYCCDSKYLLKDILRDEWNFKGFTITDFIWGVHDSVKSLKNGMDVEMPFTLKRGFIGLSLKKDKEADRAAIESCKLITATLLRTQGLYRKQKYDLSVVACNAHTELARRALEEGAVLLKNNGVLPVNNNNFKFAVVGRYADKSNYGDNLGNPPYMVTIGQAMKNYYDNVTVCNSKSVKKCEEAAKDSDIVVVVAGYNNNEEGEYLVNLPGNQIGGDRHSLRLNKLDVEIIRAMKNLGKKVVVIFYAGSAVLFDEWVDCADAVVFAGYPGMEGGNALVNLLSGKVNFSGKLPFTIAKKEDDYPEFMFTGNKPTIMYGYYHGYSLLEHENKEPAYPFGFGLSYTTFKYENLKADRKEDGVYVNVDMINTGNVEGRGICELYIGSNLPNKPKKLLRGFSDATLKPKQKATLTMFVPNNKLELFDGKNDKYVMPEKITVYAGASVLDKDLIKIQI